MRPPNGHHQYEIFDEKIFDISRKSLFISILHAI